jgi:LDH2 family malate/lactate/ureidoglycolate dehydrogenase
MRDPSVPENHVLFEASALERFCGEIFASLDVPQADARLASQSLVEVDLRGVGSHGVIRLKIYADRLQAKATNPRLRIRTMRQTRSTAVIDGDNGLGHIVAEHAMRLAVAKGEAGEPAFVSVANSNHYGAAARYAELACRAGMIGFSFTIGAINHMVPWGGAEAILGNNPFAIALPRRSAPAIVLDMACSVAARGKIMVAAKEGRAISDGWAVGPDGMPTTDPVTALAGFVSPIGGAKGYALTLTVGLLSTMLSGAAFGSEVTDLYEVFNRPQNVGHLHGVIPIAAFTDLNSYYARIEKAAAEVTSVRKSPGVERIFLPGEREALMMGDRRTHGGSGADRASQGTCCARRRPRGCAARRAEKLTPAHDRVALCASLGDPASQPVFPGAPVISACSREIFRTVSGNGGFRLGEGNAAVGHAHDERGSQ